MERPLHSNGNTAGETSRRRRSMIAQSQQWVDRGCNIRSTVVEPGPAVGAGNGRRQSFAFCPRCRSMCCRLTVRCRKASTPDSRTAAEADARRNDPLATRFSASCYERGWRPKTVIFKPIEHELARRGFGKIIEAVGAAILFDNPQERMRLVDKVLAQPGGGSEAWLLLLARMRIPTCGCLP